MAALLRLLGLARRSWALCDGRRGGAAHTAWISVVSVSALAHRAVVRVLGQTDGMLCGLWGRELPGAGGKAEGFRRGRGMAGWMGVGDTVVQRWGC